MFILPVFPPVQSFTLISEAGQAVVRWQNSDVIKMAVTTPVAVAEDSKPVEPLYLGYPHGPKDAQFAPKDRAKQTYRISVNSLRATMRVGAETFACSMSDAAPIGSTYGRPQQAYHDSIYDRAHDWLVTFEADNLELKPSGQAGYAIRAEGKCTVVFRPNYVRDHLGYFLWDKSRPLWKRPVAGWCSWMAHLQDVKESDIVDAAKFFSKNLKAYGYDVIQIDDGFQRVKQFNQEQVSGEPFSSFWTKPNEKFPKGMDGLAKAIKAEGMTPGVWIGDYLPLGLKNSGSYVTDPDGKPHKGPWVNYAMNGLDPTARNEGYIDTVREFKKQGWDYFKIDTLRHVLYDSYRQVPGYWEKRGQSMEEAFRAIMAETKKVAGSSYVLACWGVMPELAGLADGARIGEDVGPNFESMQRTAKYIAQFQYLNNVVWSNDPDYMCLRVPVPMAQAWATMCFLAGGHIMVSDPISAYDQAHVDVLRKVGPTIFTRPINAKSMKPDPEYFALAAEKGGESWTVLARMAWSDLPAGSPRFAIAPGRYLAFDFWREKFLGVVEKPEFDRLERGTCQVISLRPDLGRPQVLGTNRHLSQGVYELDKVRWNANRLSGTFRRDPGQQWSLYVRVPSGWKVEGIEPKTLTHTRDGEVLRLTFPEGSGAMEWAVSFARNA